MEETKMEERKKLNFKLLSIFAIIGSAWCIFQMCMIFDLTYDMSVFCLIFNNKRWLNCMNLMCYGGAGGYGAENVLAEGATTMIIFNTASPELLTIFGTLLWLANIGLIIWIGTQVIPVLVDWIKLIIGRMKAFGKATKTAMTSTDNLLDYKLEKSNGKEDSVKDSEFIKELKEAAKSAPDKLPKQPKTVPVVEPVIEEEPTVERRSV